MPQNEPMSAEAFARKLQEFAERIEIPKMNKISDALQFYEKAKKAERDEWENLIKSRDAQLIRLTLEVAAERARSWYIRTAGVEGCKSLEEAILEPLKGA
jgi:hypothetical protein